MPAKNIVAIGYFVAFVAMYFWLAYPISTEKTAISAVLGGLLAWVSYSDSTSRRIPNIAVILIAAFGALAIYYLESEALLSRLYISIIFFVCMFYIHYISSRIAKSGTFGMGDIKLVAASLFWLGPHAMVSAAISALALGLGFILLMVIARRRKLRDPIPFGPFIAMSVWGYWLLKISP